MKMIYKIARAEFRTLFYSPIAWLIILVFYIVCGFSFVDPLVDAARIQEANLETTPLWPGFPFALSVGIFIRSINNILENLYLFIPLLTMGAINREVNAGTIRLLYSSPVRARDIVFGKYLGLLAFSLILLLVVALLFFTGYCAILHAEIKWYLTILLAFFLLSGAFISIGIFISSLTQYQVVAGILTFIVFWVLQILSRVWQQYDLIRDITWFLAMANRAERIVSGLISTRDIFYFLIIIAMFLGLSLIKLKSTQHSRPRWLSFVRYALVTLLALTAGYFSSIPDYVGYLDVTRDKVNSITPSTQAVLKELDGSPLTVTLYTNILGRASDNGLPERRNSYVWDFWEKFAQFYPHIRYRYVYYYDVNDQNRDMLSLFPNKTMDEAAAAVAELHGVPASLFQKPAAIRKQVNLQNEDLGLVMELEYKGRKELLRTFPDTRVFPDQLHVSGTIRRLARSIHPKIYFTTGHYERSPFRSGEREYGYNTNYRESRFAMINMGVDIDTLSLLQREIPSDISLLVVADPKSSLDNSEMDKIIHYIENGGNAIFYGEPGKQQMLNPLLRTIGVTLDPGIVVIPSKHELPHTFPAVVTDTGLCMAEEEVLHNARMKRASAGIFLSGGANISYRDTAGFSIAPVYGASATQDGWIENGPFLADSAAPVFSPAEGDVRKSYFTLGVQLTRKVGNKQQRIMVSGDADFMTPRRAYGGAIRNGMFSWTLYGDYPVYANYPEPIDVKVNLGFDAARMLYTVYVYVIPGTVLLFATLLLVRRQRK